MVTNLSEDQIQACLQTPTNKNRENRSAEQMVKVKGKIRSGERRGRKGHRLHLQCKQRCYKNTFRLDRDLDSFYLNHSACICQTHVVHGPLIRIIKDTLWSSLLNKDSVCLHSMFLPKHVLQILKAQHDTWDACYLIKYL